MAAFLDSFTANGTWTKRGRLMKTNLSAGLTQENKIDQYSSNYIQRQCDRTGCEKMFNVNIHRRLLLSRKNTPVLNARIAGGKFNVNNSKYFNGSINEKPGETRSIPNQIEAKLIERSANASLNVALETNLILSAYQRVKFLSTKI